MATEEFMEEVKAELETRSAAAPDTNATLPEAPSGEAPEASPEAAAPATVEPAAQADEPPPAAPAKPEPASWINDDVKALAAMYGMEEAEVAEFTSAEEFSRAARMASKQLSDAGRRQREQRQPASSPAPAPAAVHTPAKPSAAQLDQTASMAAKMKAAGYDAEAIALAEGYDSMAQKVALLERQSAAAEAERAEYVQAYYQAEQTRKVNAFHDALDSLDADRYGKSVDEKGKILPLSKEALAARQAAFNRANDMIVGAEANGRPVPIETYRALAREVDAAVFAAENAARDKAKAAKELADKVRSNRGLRLGSGATTAKASPHKGPLSTDPEFMAQVRDIMDAGA